MITEQYRMMLNEIEIQMKIVNLDDLTIKQVEQFNKLASQFNEIQADLKNSYKNDQDTVLQDKIDDLAKVFEQFEQEINPLKAEDKIVNNLKAAFKMAEKTNNLGSSYQDEDHFGEFVSATTSSVVQPFKPQSPTSSSDVTINHAAANTYEKLDELSDEEKIIRRRAKNAKKATSGSGSNFSLTNCLSSFFCCHRRKAAKYTAARFSLDGDELFNSSVNSSL